MEHKSSKQMILSVLGILILVVAVVGVTFAFFTYSKEGSVENSITSGTLTLNYNENVNGINISNAVPISDTKALTSTTPTDYFDFTVDYNIVGSANIKYEIDLVDRTEQSTAFLGGIKKLESKNLKVALVNTDTNTRVLEPTYLSVIEKAAASNSKDGYKTYEKIVNTSGSDRYRMFMWIAETDAEGNLVSMMDVLSETETDAEGNPVVIQKGINNQTFSVKINIQAIDIANAGE